MLTGKATVHWIGCINAIKQYIVHLKNNNSKMHLSFSSITSATHFSIPKYKGHYIYSSKRDLSRSYNLMQFDLSVGALNTFQRVKCKNKRNIKQ